MKKSGILHPELARVIASLGHGDGLCIADAGLPVPAGVLRIDLALGPGLPPFCPCWRPSSGKWPWRAP